MSIEICGCCGGTGKIKESEFIDGDEESCMTCNGKGSFEYDEDYDPSPYCSQCGAMKQANCKCGPIADNE